MFKGQKEALTTKNIEQDIKNSLKEQKNMTEHEYKSLTVPCIIAAVILVIIEIVYPEAILWLLLALLLSLIIVSIFRTLRIKYMQKRVNIENYDVAEDIVSHTSHEHYKKTQSSFRAYSRVDIYTVHFESGKSWRIPKDNYAWSEEHKLSDWGVFQDIHRGDSIIVVIEKASGNIVMAYPEKSFDRRF